MCDALAPFAAHFFTNRTWKLGESSAGEDAWAEVAEALELTSVDLGHLRQVHGTDVIVRRNRNSPDDERRPDEPLPIGDIIITDDPRRAVAVKAADCLPILFVDRRTHAVAAAHAGWRGLAAKVPVVTVNRLGVEFGSRPYDLLVAIGPAIGACCYEVGEDVRTRFSTFSADDVNRWFAEKPSTSPMNPSIPSVPSEPRYGHWFFDGWQCARDQLTSAGVPSGQIFVAELCSASHSSMCSYRRDGAGSTGRMVGVISPDPSRNSRVDPRGR